MDNDFFQGVVTSVVQRALTSVFALMVAGGWITQDQATGLLLIIAGLVGSAIMYGYVYFKNKAAAKLAEKQIEIALDKPSSTPVAVVVNEAKAAVANS